MPRLSKKERTRLEKEACDWTGGTIYQRLQDCRAMLSLWGYISFEHNKKIRARLEDDMGVSFKKRGHR